MPALWTYETIWNRKMKIVIYTQDLCEFCDSAKKEFEKRSWYYIVHNVKHEDNKKALLELLPNAKTVPQIWIDDEYIGGYYELMTWIEDGKYKYV